MSLTFTLTGKASTLSTNFFPPITLDGEWEVGLLNFEAYNSIHNLINGEVTIRQDITKSFVNRHAQESIESKFLNTEAAKEGGKSFQNSDHKFSRW